MKHDGVVYHFYCAVNNAEQRGIAIATSKPMGRSAVRFPKPEIKNRRQIIELNEGWKTWRVENGKLRVESEKTVNIPHNWDDYYGYRQLTHGNLHGTVLYKRTSPSTTLNSQLSTLNLKNISFVLKEWVHTPPLQ